MKRVLRFAPWVLGPLCVLGLAEWLLRRGGYEYERIANRATLMPDEIRGTRARSPSLYQPHPHQLWSPRPGAVLPWTSGERINPDGYRGPQLDVERAKGRLRIAFLGGAATLGVGVRNEDTFAALATRLVSERKMPAECLNAGVEGFSLRQCLERYRDLIHPYRPHAVVLSIAASTSYRQAPYGKTDDQRIHQARLHESAPAQRGAWNDLRVFQFTRWLKDAIGGHYWVERDIEFHEMRLAPKVGDLDWPGERRVPIDDYYYSLSWLLQESRQDGAHLILLSIPGAPDQSAPPVLDVYQRTVNEFADREKLLVLDGRNAYLAALRDDIPKEDLFQSDTYPSECGHAQLAEALADTIVRAIDARSARVPDPVPGPTPR